MKLKYYDYDRQFYVFNLPFIPQYEDYKYSKGLCCPNCGGTDFLKSFREGIVGYSTSHSGEFFLLRECPLCGTKWKSLVSQLCKSKDEFVKWAAQFLKGAYEIGDSRLLVEKGSYEYISLMGKIIEL